MSALGAFLLGKRAAILRAWRRELRAEALLPPDFDEVLAPLVAELPAMLASGDDVPRLFAARLRGLGARRFSERSRLRDVAREIGLLWSALLAVWQKHAHDLPVAAALVLGRTIGEAMVQVARDYERAGEQALAVRRLRGLSDALAELEEIVLVLDRRGVVAMAAGPTERLLGKPPADLVGTPGSGPALKALQGGRPLGPARARVRNPVSGEERMCETRAFPLVEDGQIEGSLELIRDVTVDLQREDELRRADRELGALHGRLLRRAHGEAMAELASATVSSLNNELNAVAMALSLVRSDAPSESARHLAAVAAAVERAAAALARFQQLAARKPSAPTRAVALNQVLLEALDLVRPELGTSAGGGHGAMRIDAHLGELPPVLAQAGELRDVLCSLFLEARDLLHDRANAAVKASTRPERDGASLLLTLPSAAEPAEVVLAAAQRRVRRWGGELTCETRGGQTTLRLSLVEAAARAPSPAAAPAAAAAQRVLIVDDDAGNRDTLGELLALSGHEVTAAASGEQALAAVDQAKRPFEVALVDLAMPDMNGVALARALHDRNRAIRVALVTGWDPTVLEGLEHYGVIEAVFRKPLDLAAILRFLDGKAAAAPGPQPGA